MKKIKGIIVGTGKAGTELHFGAITVNGAEIVAFVDLNKSAAQEAAKRLGVHGVYDSLAKALENEKVDFVSICTTVGSHASLAEEALRAGAHVLLEKPMTATLAEADHLSNVVKETGRTITVVHNHKFYPGIQKAKGIIDSGEIGSVIHVHREMSFIHDKVRMMEPNHWAHKVLGGRLFEANPHNLYLIYDLIGPFELKNICGRKVSDRWHYIKIDEFVATGQTKAGTVSLHMSLSGEGSNNHGANFLLVVGSKDSLVVTYHDIYLLSSKWYSGLISRLTNAIKKRFERYPILKDISGRLVNIGVGSGHYFYMKEYISYLQGNRATPPVSWDEAYFVEKMNEEMGMEIEKSLNKYASN